MSHFTDTNLASGVWELTSENREKHEMRTEILISSLHQDNNTYKLARSTKFPEEKCVWPRAQSTGSCHGTSQNLQLLAIKFPPFKLLKHTFLKFRKHIANDFL